MSPGTTDPRSARGRGASVEAYVAATVTTGAFVLPLLFVNTIEDAFALPKAIAVVVLSSALLVGLVVLLVRRGLSLDWSEEVLVVYLVLVTAATLRSSDPLQSTIGEPLQYQGLLLSLAYGTAFLSARRTMRTDLRIRRLGGAIFGAALLVALYGLIQQSGHDPFWQELDKGRIFSSLGQANSLAAYLVIALPIMVVFGSAMPRWIAWVGVVAVVAALGLTLSRGGYFGALVSMVVFWICIGRPGLSRRGIELAVVGVLGALLVIAVVPAIRTPVQRIAERAVLGAALDESSTASHLDLWAVGIRVALDNPILGVGPEIYPSLFPEYRDRVLSPARAAIMARFRPESPHNVPIAVADAAGVPALVAYLALVAGILLAAARRLGMASRGERWLLAGLVAAVVGHLVTDLFMTAEAAGSWTFWVLLGVLSSLTSAPRSTDVPDSSHCPFTPGAGDRAIRQP